MNRLGFSMGRSLVFAFLRNISMTTWLICFNVTFFIISSIVFAFSPSFINNLALQPSAILQGKYLWTMFTHMFMHAGFFHLFFNMFSLFFVGTFLEKIIGRKRFLWFYLISGIIAGIFFILLSGFFGYGIGERIFGSPLISGVGASGAIFGLVGVLAVLTPRNRVYLIVGPLIAIVIGSIFSNPVTDLILNIYILVSLFAVFSFNPSLRKLALPVEMRFWVLPFIAILPLVVIGLFFELPIANTAHFGGLLAGLFYGLYLRSKYKRKVRMLDRMFR